MTLNFPPNPPLDFIFEPGNGLKYKWDGSQWSQLERTLKTIYPIDLDRVDGTIIVKRELTTYGGSKDFTYVFVDPLNPINDDEFDNGKNISSYPNFFDHFTFKNNTIGINDLVNSDELYSTEKLTGLVDTFSIDGVTDNNDGTVRVDVTNKEFNTGYHAYDDGNVFNFSYGVNEPSDDEYTHFIDLTTITKI